VRRVLLCTALLLSAPAARAASKSVSLDWVRLAGAESCASSAELVAAVEKRLGREVFTIATKSDLAIEGRVERTKSTWRATIVSRADGKTLGTRVVDSAESSCRALDEAIVLVLAVTIDPDGEAVPPPDPPPPPKPTYVTVVKHVRHDVVVPVEKASEWRADIRLSATGAVGVLPGFAPGARLSGMFEHRAFVPVELDARVLAGASDDADRSTAFNHFSGVWRSVRGSAGDFAAKRVPAETSRSCALEAQGSTLTTIARFSFPARSCARAGSSPSPDRCSASWASRPRRRSCARGLSSQDQTNPAPRSTNNPDLP
jgi:hypothetical protein